MTFNATPSDPLANSYCDVAFADEYWGQRLYGTTWLAADVPTKQQALIQATMALDNYDYVGVKGVQGQALRWPRYGGKDQDGYPLPLDVVPNRMKQATAELAGSLLSEDRTSDNGMTNLKELKVGPIQITFDENQRLNNLTPFVRQMINPFLKTVYAKVVRS
jgi:hypothetical protein